MAKSVRLRQRAAQDIDEALEHYHREGGAPLATRFIDALERAMGHLGGHPLTGSLRYSYELDIPKLRTWPLRKFPYIVFYIDDDEHVDVWRVLHSHRDIPASLAQPEGPEGT